MSTETVKNLSDNELDKEIGFAFSALSPTWPETYTWLATLATEKARRITKDEAKQ